MSVLTAIRKLVRSDEDLATLALAHVLESSAVARDAMNSLLGVDPDTRWSPQHVLKDEGRGGGRPDLAGRSDGRNVAFVEAKFDAGLTAAQPVEYLRRLDTDGHLVGLVPESRLGYLTRELLVRSRNEFAVEEVPSGGWLVMVDGQPRRLSLVTWDALVGHLVRETARPEARDAHDDLIQIRDMVDVVQGQLYRPMTSQQITGREIAQANVQILDLHGSLRDALLDAGFEARGNFTSSTGGWQGYGIARPRAILSWQVHVSWSLWRALAPTPFWLTLAWDERRDHRDLLRPWLDGLPPRAHDVTAWQRPPIAVPLRLTPEDDRDQVIADLVSQIVSATDDGEALLGSESGRPIVAADLTAPPAGPNATGESRS